MMTRRRRWQALVFRVAGWCILSPGMAHAALDTARLELMLNRGEINEAQQLVLHSLKASGLKTSDASVENVIGWAYFSFGNVVEAEARLKAALKSAEEHEERQIAMLAANNLGIVYFTENRLDEAEFYFGMGYNADTDVAKEYRRLIEAKRRETALSKALEQGKQQRYEKKFEQAVTSYETVLILDPRNVAALEYKGYALYRLGRFAEASEALEAARSIDPSQRLVHLNIVKVECARKSEDGVRQAMERSSLPLAQFAEWYQLDTEFKVVCGENAAVRNILEAYPRAALPPT